MSETKDVHRWSFRSNRTLRGREDEEGLEAPGLNTLSNDLGR